MAWDSFFIVLSIPSNHLEKTARTKSTLPPAFTKHYLIHHLPQNNQMLTIKQENYNAIKLLVQSNLDSIADIISCTFRMNTSHLLNIMVLQEVENIANLRLILETKLKPR